MNQTLPPTHKSDQQGNLLPPPIMVSPSIKINITPPLQLQITTSLAPLRKQLEVKPSRKFILEDLITSLIDESYYYEMALLEIETGLKLNATGQISIKQTVLDYNYFLYYTGTHL